MQNMETNIPNLESTLVCLKKVVQRLSTENFSSKTEQEELNVILGDLLKEFRSDYVISLNSFYSHDSEIGSECGSDIRWQFVELICSLLLRLCDELKDAELSLSNYKTVKECVFWVAVFGVPPNLLKGLSVIVKDVVSFPNPANNVSDAEKYARLCAIVNVLVKCLQHTALRIAMLNYLGCILIALCQLGYAPLKKPSTAQEAVSDELYKMYCNDQIFYRNMLEGVINSVYQPRVIQELMIILGSQKDKTPPTWLKKCCSKLLTQLLVSPGGVSAVIRSLMESSVDTGTDWKTVAILIKIITSPKHYYASIYSQLTELLTSSNASKSCTEVSIACVNELLMKEPLITQVNIIGKLLKPLTCLSSLELQNSYQSGKVLIREEKFTLCLEHLHQYFASSGSSSSLPSLLLHPVSHILFHLYGNIKEGVSHITSLVAQLFYCVLKDCSSTTLNKIVKAVIFKEPSDSILHPGKISFVMGPNGGIQVEMAKEIVRGVEYSAVEEAGDILMYLLDKKDSDGNVSYSLFVILLEIVSDFGLDPPILEPCHNVLSTIEDAIGQLVLHSERHVGAVRLLAGLAENSNVQKKLSQKPDCVIGFLKIVLQREVKRADCYEEQYSDKADILCVALMILEVIISGNRDDINWDSLHVLVPFLENLKNVASNQELQNLVGHIFNSIVTKGVVMEESTEQSCKKPVNSIEKSECDEAFEDSCDPLLPVRGHALVKLTTLINLRDRHAVAKKDAILCLFQENLKTEDTFIYLAAINGIAAMASYFPDTVLSILTEEFTMAVSTGNSDSHDNLTRIKIGEVLVRATRGLGEMTPKYKSQLLNAFLLGVKDVDPLVRASSLSNLGEACRALGFCIGPILQEILVCIRDVVSSDKAAEPRRAAVMVITLLLQGLQKDALKVLSDDMLLLYRALKHLYLTETDHATKLHAQLALEEVDSIARTFLLLNIDVPKKITMT